MQVTLPAEHHRAAAEKAATHGVSLAEYIRRLVVADLGRDENGQSDITELFGIGDSGGGDAARHLDAYLGEAAIAGHAEETHPR
jgi:hypothetical protein